MLEHLYVEMCSERAELVFFLHEDIGDGATGAVLRLWGSVARGIPQLGSWVVLDDITMRPIDPF
ncbi:hypothetical protein [Nocardiopsis sp. CNT312]|uniref:hypothetical protein n=1 Tax=Nocardiopsis sp. CNT312 TaxID=1137268 RepID=UPI001E34637F|nr:hypothetical protein [Nocardiopsis sp. CNT312]